MYAYRLEPNGSRLLTRTRFGIPRRAPRISSFPAAEKVSTPFRYACAHFEVARKTMASNLRYLHPAVALRRASEIILLERDRAGY